MRGGVGEQHRVHFRRQFPRPDRAALGHPYPVPAAAEAAGELGEGAARGPGVPAEVEQAEGTGVFGCEDDPRVGLPERADGDDEFAPVGGEPVGLPRGR